MSVPVPAATQSRPDAPPPTLEESPLVPGSPIPNHIWVRAAYRLATGLPMVEVARLIGCHRTTLWRAYTQAPAFRRRIAEERECLLREAGSRVQMLRSRAVLAIEAALDRGDGKVIMWLAERLELFNHDFSTAPFLAETADTVDAAPTEDDIPTNPRLNLPVPEPQPHPPLQLQPAPEPQPEPADATSPPPALHDVAPIPISIRHLLKNSTGVSDSAVPELVHEKRVAAL